MRVGLLTAWPILYFVIFMSFIASAFFAIASGAGKNLSPDSFRYLVPLHLLTMLITIVLMVIFVAHAFRTDRIPEDRRVLWVVVLFLGNMFAFPVYWYFYFWRVGPREVSHVE
jgi:hypothetical protein